MTDETQNTELLGSVPGDTSAAPELTPGALLKAAREKAGVSVKKIASDMRVSLTIINALENDQYEKIAAETFVLGYIRTYVRQLNLSSDPFIEAYQQYRQKHKLPTQGFGESTRRVEQVLKLNQPIKVHKPGSPWLKLLMWILVLVVVVLALFSVFGGQIAQKLGIDKPMVLTVVPALDSSSDAQLGAAGEQLTIANPLEGVAAEAVVEEGAQAGGEVAVETVTDGQATGVIDRSGAVTDAAASTAPVEATVIAGQSSTPTAQPDTLKSEVVPVQAAKAAINNPSVLTSSDSKAGLDTLVLKFTGECWLEVSDSRGDILTVELYQAGSSLTLQGEAPFDVLMGNVRAVSVMINGKAVPLQPEGDSKTLRTQIDKL